jgi:3-deoxy-D-manno-octulosonic-acid transferase
VTGNIKYDRDLVEQDVTESQARALDEALELGATGRPLIVAGSTHPGEEEILLEVFRNLRGNSGLENSRLLLVPRHPERFNAVANLAEQSGFQVRRRTGPGGGAPAEVLLLDTLGELASAYRFATVAFVGGTLIRHGGQSILEPALHAKPIVIGPSMENFPQIIDEFRKRGAVRQISATVEDRPEQVRQLTEAFRELLLDGRKRLELGQAGFSVFENNRGAADRTIRRITEILQNGRRP